MTGRKFGRIIMYLAAIFGITAGFSACNTMRYVPKDSYLLRKNEVEIERAEKEKGIKKSQRVSEKDLAPYIQQRPNNRLLGMGIYLGFYNMTDTSKHKGWHRFWREKVGEAPVIYDSTLNDKSIHMMTIYMQSRGYLNASITDTVSYKGQKARVQYRIKENRPYTISEVRYRIGDSFLEPIILEDTLQSLLKPGVIFDRDLMDAERTRISDRLQNMGFWGFNKGYISYVADSTVGDNQVRVTMRVRQRVAAVLPDGEQVLENHPIYRISNIHVNAAFDPTRSPEDLSTMRWDTITHRGVDISYTNRLQLKRNVLVDAIRLSPNEIYDWSSVQKTYGEIRNLQYNANILFSELPYDTLSPIEVTRASSDGEQTVSTTERNLHCLIQCTPNVKQSFNVDMELSTTSEYYSSALSFGYQNKNIGRGAEVFRANIRGAYELMKKSGKRNSFEVGATVGLDVPRFWLPFRTDWLSKFRSQKTNMQLSYNIQRRPYYNRTIASGVYGYSWSFKSGARFQINPFDLNVISVPWVDEGFLAEIDNPYLRNSYESQLIAGVSASYYYTTNPNPKASSFTVRAMGDVNGNILRGFTSWFGRQVSINPGTPEQEDYYRILGIRYAQYARMSLDLSSRVNPTETTQFAYRFYIGGGYAYGNSKILPFERLFFAGGSNSMRGWQVRTLGPGETPYIEGTYPNQLGDFRLEWNAEYRFKVAGNFGMALFADAGNVWMNSKGANPDARFKLNRFYKQIALAGGLGFRYDIGFVLLRLDWGMKIHNPNVEKGDRWNSGFKFKETALHFAIGLPF